MSISMKRYNDTIITPKDDRILFDQIFDDYGLIYGGSATMAASNKIHVGAARGFIKGTEVIIEAEDIAVNLSDSGTKNGRLKIVMDLADTETPIKFESEVAASFPALEQDANINYDNGRYEVVFATYKTTETTISSVTLVMPTMQSVKAKIQGINQSLENCLKSVSDGKKTVANAITAQGVNTAADAEFATMAANIGTAGANKYNSGYSSGRTQGQNDVKNSPNSYGLYTKAQYDANKVTYKSGNYNTGLNGETWRSTSFNTGFSTIIALQINCWNDEGNGYFNAFKNVRISGGKVSLDFYAADYVNNYVQWLAVGK